jgi:hypothetical protein
MPSAAGPSNPILPSTPASTVQPTVNRDSRIHTHSHIKGLGLSPEGHALPIGQGFVGQAPAREALGLHLGLLRSGKYSGRPLLLVGPPGTGKVSRQPSSSVMHDFLTIFFASVRPLYLWHSLKNWEQGYLSALWSDRRSFPVKSRRPKYSVGDSGELSVSPSVIIHPFIIA